jgi:Ser/Thr protein kinase RdoA (MazF antagonist)/predicted GNAT family N-acyltransferase
VSTDDFFALTPERVLSAVESLGVRCTGMCYPLNSLENRVYEIEREDRSRVVAKFYRPGRWSPEAVRDEHQFLADLVASEIPVAAPIAFRDGSTAQTVAGTEILCALFPRVGGRVPDECTDEQLRRLGGLLARIHTVGASRTASHRVALTVEKYGRETLATLLAAPTLPTSIAPKLKAVCRTLFARIEPWFDGVGTHRVHGDCHPGNLLWGSEGPFFLDFDDMLTGPPVQDLWMLVAASDAEGVRQREVTLEGYEMFRAFDRTTLRLIEPLRALRYLHYAAWVTRRWHDPAFPKAFPHYGTERYWSELTDDLNDQVVRIESYGATSTPSLSNVSSVTVTQVRWSDEDFAKIWMIREEVFCDELGRSFDEESDSHDRSATHLLALDRDGRAVGCARVVLEGETAVLSRVAVRDNKRRKGVGRALVIAARQLGQNTRVDAIETGVGFFEILGFQRAGEGMVLAGIATVRMTLGATN